MAGQGQLSGRRQVLSWGFYRFPCKAAVPGTDFLVPNFVPNSPDLT
jgi:hypothetical protein